MDYRQVYPHLMSEGEDGVPKHFIFNNFLVCCVHLKTHCVEHLSESFCCCQHSFLSCCRLCLARQHFKDHAHNLLPLRYTVNNFLKEHVVV